MKTVKDLAAAITDSAAIAELTTQMLAELDPHFPEEEKKYSEAAEQLRNLCREQAQTLLESRESELAASVLYLVWLGFRQNLANYRDPIHALLLEQDFEILHQEHRMHALIGCNMGGLSETLPEEAEPWLLAVSEYYAYLQTAGFKLAHLYGYELGNCLLPRLIPGYTPDRFASDRYRSRVSEYLQFDVSAML